MVAQRRRGEERDDFYDMEETFHDTTDQFMSKGRRRHVRSGLKEIEQCMVLEAKISQEAELSILSSTKDSTSDRFVLQGTKCMKYRP